MKRRVPYSTMSALALGVLCGLAWVGCAKPGDVHLAPLNDAHRAVETGITALAQEGEVCLAQLDNLVGAIRSEATVDSEGTPMDEAYFGKATARELELVAKWEAAVAETERLVDSGLELEGQTRTSLDSLIRTKRAEWAQQIAENE